MMVFCPRYGVHHVNLYSLFPLVVVTSYLDVNIDDVSDRKIDLATYSMAIYSKAKLK